MSTPEADRSHEISSATYATGRRRIMDGLERGERYAVTRNGHHIGDLVPLLVAAEAQVLAQRMKILQTAEGEFDPLPFDDTAAREYSQLWTAVIASGRKPHPRTADLTITNRSSHPRGPRRLSSISARTA
ncbi:hypothetical protein [Nonomuraea sp. NPDC049695]|uniref:hypothetical protein n=1 Tax=Nonomuraea sp. NPDC049695 TaxID=3154734 RepID=UPI003426A1C1